MLERLKFVRPARVIGADGKPLTLQELPANDVRWNKKRKAQVVAAVRGNLISFADAARRYGLSPGEFSAWESEVLEFLAARQRAVERRDFRVLRREVRAGALIRLRAG
jgi:transposase-like protein